MAFLISTFDTAGWAEGDYTIRVDATSIGYNDLMTSFSLEAVEPFVEEPEEPSFWESYGATVTGLVVVLALIAVVAVYMYKK